MESWRYIKHYQLFFLLFFYKQHQQQVTQSLESPAELLSTDLNGLLRRGADRWGESELREEGMAGRPGQLMCGTTINVGIM